jgi:hypothetical protein
MPTILIEGYKFRFYSSDIQEPPHVHVIRGDNVAKIWLADFMVQSNNGYNQRELNRILGLARENQTRLLEAWHEHFRRK